MVGRSFGEAMLKSQLGAGSRLPSKGTVCITVKNSDKARAVEVARELHRLGLKIAMLTGDNERAAQSVADDVGIDGADVEDMRATAQRTEDLVWRRAGSELAAVETLRRIPPKSFWEKFPTRRKMRTSLKSSKIE